MMPVTMTRRLMCSAPILRRGVSAGSPLHLTWTLRIWSAYMGSRIRSLENAAMSKWGRWSTGLSRITLARSSSKA